jgi:hypothetical protein
LYDIAVFLKLKTLLRLYHKRSTTDSVCCPDGALNWMLGKPNSTGGVTPCDNEPFCQNYTTSLDDSIQQAMRAGVNVDDNGPTFISNLIAALQNGMASMQLVDDSARRVLMAGASLGLMDPPDGFYDTIQETDTALARQLALEAAEQGESGPSYLDICPR